MEKIAGNKIHRPTVVKSFSFDLFIISKRSNYFSVVSFNCAPQSYRIEISVRKQNVFRSYMIMYDHMIIGQMVADLSLEFQCIGNLD